MKFKHVFLGFTFFITALSFSQELQREVLFTIDEKPYYTDEFVRVYNKNLDLVKDDSQKDLDHYLDLFVGYKLKINKANKLGLQNGKQYLSELKSYRNQLSKNYLTDIQVTETLLNEAYNRSLKEVNASHILFLVDENALPADTLKVYNKAIEVRNKAIAGEDFGTLAEQYSEDPSAKENKGNLGYFSVFRMVYPFETGAFTTPKGEISKPVRSRFGYHVIKVNDIRDNRGAVTVAHIMIAKPSEEDTAGNVTAKNTINEIAQKLKQGEDFANLAKQFSQDESTASNGGILSTFGSGELNAIEFEDAAFSLNQAGQISEPFETSFGWHIVKLIEKIPVAKFDDVKTDFENKIKRDDRSRRITASLNDKLRKKYTVVKDDKVYSRAVKLVNDDFYAEAWKLPKDIENYNQVLLTINNDKKIPLKTFLNYINTKQQTGLNAKPISNAVSILFTQFANEQLNSYYDNNLEKEFPEFGIVMEEYRDGLLLFDLMEKEIWEKAKTDTIGLEKFYAINKEKYQWKDRVDVDIYSSTKKDVAKKVKKYLKNKKSIDYIKEKLNTKEKVNVMLKSGIFEQESTVLPKRNKWETGISDVIKEGDYYYIIQTKKVLPKGLKTLEENKGKVINDYQQQLESEWVKNLKQEFKVSVNDNVFEDVKKQINK